MRAVRVHQPGPPSAMQVDTNVPIPEPSKTQVLVHVKAAGVNPVDTYIRAGMFPNIPPTPFIPGMDVAGVVEKVGESVKRFKKGDRVFMFGTTSGGYAEYATAEESHTFELPANATFEQGAGLGVPYLTAYRAMYQIGHLKPGQSLFVHGASGAVGLACVQMARRRGVTCIAGTAGTDEAIAMLSDAKLCGPNGVFNHRTPDYVSAIKKAFPKGFDCIVEMLADVNLASDVELVAPKGDIVVVGSHGVSNNVAGTRLMMTEARISGVILLIATDAELLEAGQDVIAGVRDGTGLPIISATYPFEKAPEAHEHVMRSSKLPGKILLAP